MKWDVLVIVSIFSPIHTRIKILLYVCVCPWGPSICARSLKRTYDWIIPSRFVHIEHITLRSAQSFHQLGYIKTVFSFLFLVKNCLYMRVKNRIWQHNCQLSASTQGLTKLNILCHYFFFFFFFFFHFYFVCGTLVFLLGQQATQRPLLAERKAS